MRQGSYIFLMSAKRTAEERLVDAALRLAAKKPWEEISFQDILKSARLTLAKLPPSLHSKPAIVSAFISRVDAELLASIDPEEFEEARPRDRLFDVLMTRFEILEENKAAVRSIAQSMQRDPLGALTQAETIDRSMGWALAAAQIDAEGLVGAARRRGLGLVWLAAFRVWLREDDLNKVMAELDNRLAQGEKWLTMLRGRRGARQGASARAGGGQPLHS